VIVIETIHVIAGARWEEGKEVKRVVEGGKFSQTGDINFGNEGDSLGPVKNESDTLGPV